MKANQVAWDKFFSNWTSDYTGRNRECIFWRKTTIANDETIRFYYEKKRYNVKRLAFTLFMAPLNQSDKLINLCKNIQCINPLHLRVKLCKYTSETSSPTTEKISKKRLDKKTFFSLLDCIKDTDASREPQLSSDKITEVLSSKHRTKLWRIKTGKSYSKWRKEWELQNSTKRDYRLEQDKDIPKSHDFQPSIE